MLTNIAIILALAVGQAVPAREDPRRCASADDAAPIVEQRQAFNAAIREADLPAVSSVLAADVVLVAGTHSDLFTGRAAQLTIWREDFAKGADRLVYIRTPECIERSGITPMALEFGRWRGEDASGNFAAGRYTAKWRRVDGVWVIEAEIFMTDDCGGEGCPE